MVNFLIILAVGCTLATLLTIAPILLSSRISRSQPEAEAYEATVISQNSKEFISRTYPIKINA